MKLAPLVVGVIGIGLAYILYVAKTNIPDRLASAFQSIYQFLLNKWYFDEVYEWLIVRPSFVIGKGFWRVIDGWIIDGLGPDGISATVRRVAAKVSALQTGYIYHYAFAMLIGVVVIITWYLFRYAG